MTFAGPSCGDSPRQAGVLAGKDTDLGRREEPVRRERKDFEVVHRHLGERSEAGAADAAPRPASIGRPPDVVGAESAEGCVHAIASRIGRVDRQAHDHAIRQARAVGVHQIPGRRRRGAIDGLVHAAVVVAYPADVRIARRYRDRADQAAGRRLDRTEARWIAELCVAGPPKRFTAGEQRLRVARIQDERGDEVAVAVEIRNRVAEKDFRRLATVRAAEDPQPRILAIEVIRITGIGRDLAAIPAQHPGKRLWSFGGRVPERPVAFRAADDGAGQDVAGCAVELPATPLAWPEPGPFHRTRPAHLVHVPLRSDQSVSRHVTVFVLLLQPAKPQWPVRIVAGVRAGPAGDRGPARFALRPARLDRLGAQHRDDSDDRQPGSRESPDDAHMAPIFGPETRMPTIEAARAELSPPRGRPSTVRPCRERSDGTASYCWFRD